MTPEIKEVHMDNSFQVGGKKRRRRTRRNKAVEETNAIVTKDNTVAPVTAPAPVSVPAPAPASAPVPKIVLAPPKKKPAKIMLVPKKTKEHDVTRQHRKTFKAKHVKVTIDNTAKTRKHRTTVLEKVDTMTDEQIRNAAVHARLSRPETVGKVPITLLRQMVKDYQIMKKMLL